MRILKGSDYRLHFPTFVDTDGETPVACAVTATVTREDGTVLSALSVSTVSGATGEYYGLLGATTHTTQCDRLQVTATGTPSGGLTQSYTMEVEVVGAHYVTIPQLRAETGLANVPISLLEEVRDDVEDAIEKAAGVAYVRRYHRDLLDGNGSIELNLTKLRPRTLLSVYVSGVSQATNQFTLYDMGKIRRFNQTFMAPTSSSGFRNIAIAYEHGYDSPPARWRSDILAIMRQRVLDKTAERRPDVMYEAYGEGQGTRYMSFEQMVEKLVDKSQERLYVL